MPCKKENNGQLDATFLDLEAAIIPEEGRISYHLLDKRDDFNFLIVRFPYACSNIPSKIFLSTIGAETLRICHLALNTLPDSVDLSLIEWLIIKVLLFAILSQY